MRIAGNSLAKIMDEVASLLTPGTSTLSIDAFVERRMRESGLVPACKGYMGYQHATCISVNDVVGAYGIPSQDRVLASGDCVSVDVVGAYKGYHADSSLQFCGWYNHCVA